MNTVELKNNLFVLDSYNKLLKNNVVLSCVTGSALSYIFFRKIKAGFFLGAGIGAGYLHTDFVNQFNFIKEFNKH